MKQNIKYTAPQAKTVFFMIPYALCVGVNTSGDSGSGRTGESSYFDGDSD